MKNTKVEKVAQMLDEMVPNWFRSTVSVKQCIEYVILNKMEYKMREIAREVLLGTLDDIASWEHEIEQRRTNDRGQY